MLVIISGVSSSGKNTIMNALVKRMKNLKVLTKSSATTRAPRESDKDNNTYLFLTQEEFKNAISEGKFFEYELYSNNYYGTLKDRVEMAVNSKDVDYIRDVEVKGNVNFRKAYKDKIISIFIDAPNEVLRERLIKRGDKPEDIERRLSRSELERSYKQHYDLVVENIDLEKALQTIENFLKKNLKNK